jgi:quercetin dioxygenase-like cupin family protein
MNVEDHMRSAKASLAFSLTISLGGPCLAQGYPATPLVSTNRTVVGETIAYPPGQAVVTSSIITLAPGESTIVHRHGVPLFAYMLQGELTVDYGERGRKVYRQGDAFLEAMQVAHAGKNTGGEQVRILAVFMGAEGQRDVVPGR